MPASAERAALRARLVKGWKPRQSVWIEVRELAALLDQLDACEQLATDMEREALADGCLYPDQLVRSAAELRAALGLP